MDPFFENAQKIFDVARANGSEESTDFALLIRPDGGLHLVMDSPLSLEAAAAHGGARTAYHVTRSPRGVRVTGQSAGQTCILEESPRANPAFWLVRDQRLYQMVSGSGGGSSTEGTEGNEGKAAGGESARAMLAA